jgi:C-terminal processing protease CtpA/Prc
MNRMGRKIGIVLGIVAVLAVTGMGSILADSDRKSNSKMRWQFVDSDGKKHQEKIEIDGPRPFLGVNLERARGGSGAQVEDVIGDSAAERAGLQEGDVIVGYNGDEIETPWDLTRAVLKSEPGERVDIEIERDGSRRTLRAELGENDDWVGAFAFADGDFDFNFDFLDSDAFREQMERVQEMTFDAEGLEEHMEQLTESLEGMNFNFKNMGNYAFKFDLRRPRLGVELVGVTAELREHLGANQDEGVLVGRVLSDTPAAHAGVEVGDLIVAVGGETVGQQGDLSQLLRERDGETFNLDVIRNGRPLPLTVSLPDREDEEFQPGRSRRQQKKGRSDRN